MRLSFQHGEDLMTLDVEPDGDAWRVRLPDGTEQRLRACRLPGDILQVETIEAEGASPVHAFRVPFAQTENGLELSLAGVTYAFTPASARPSGQRRSASGNLTAPMVGTVVDVLVREGEMVEAYQPLVIVEAMKVMATVEAPFAGTVRAVHVEKGQRVAHGASVVEIAPVSEESENVALTP
jgi:biotin carboxyl carrier protein